MSATPSTDSTPDQGADASGQKPSAAQGWTAPDPNRPRASELVIAAVMVSLLAGLVLWGATVTESEPILELHAVDPAQALDAQAVPSGAFVTVSGHPDASRAAPVFSVGPGRDQDVLLALREAPRLVLHCRHGHPLAEVLGRRRRPGLKDPAPAPARELDGSWTLSGRIYDADKYSDPQLGSSGFSLQQFAAEKLGVKGDEPVRVLAVGMTPGDLRRSALTAFAFGAGLAILAIVLWTLAIHSIHQDRASRGTRRGSP